VLNAYACTATPGAQLEGNKESHNLICALSSPGEWQSVTPCLYFRLESSHISRSANRFVIPRDNQQFKKSITIS